MNKDLTILFVSCSIHGYGADYSLISLCKEVKNKGLNPVVVVPKEGRSTEYFRQNNIKYELCEFKNWVHYRHIPIISEGFGILKLLINYLQSYYLYFRIKNKYNIIGVYSNTFTNCFGIFLSKLFKVNHIQHIREFGKEDFGRYFDFGDTLSYNYINQYTNKIICVSDIVAQKYKKYFKEKVIRIYNGIPSSNLNKKEKTSESLVRIVMVGRMSRLKKHITLVKAANILKKEGFNNFQIDLIGEGTEEAVLKEFVRENKLDNLINFLGYKKNFDLSVYDVGVICSSNEAFGRVTAEYMMNHLVVVGSNGGATTELIRHGKDGYIFDVDDYEDLAYCLKKLIINSIDREEMATSAYNRAKQLFSEDRYVEEVYNVIESVYQL